MRIGIDLMGGDSAPQALFEAVVQIAEQLDCSHVLVAIATQPVLNDLMRIHASLQTSPGSACIEFCASKNSITMGDEPVRAVRHKAGSSLVLGVRLLKKRTLNAFISTGNTGALVASATLNLAMLPGIKRPALLAVLPTEGRPMAVIDVGGSVSCKSHHLIQFAHMGAAYQACSQGIDVPTVGILNIGTESKKGTLQVREAYQTLQEYSHNQSNQRTTPKMQFLGNIEGREIFRGNIDVLITDGFTGNILLKSSEGISSFIFDHIQNFLKKRASENLSFSFNDLYRSFNYHEYPGAILCGVDAVIIKCHGNASKQGLFNSIKEAINLVNNKLIEKIKKRLASHP